MRRELLDLGRRLYGVHGIGANHAGGVDDASASWPSFDPADRTNDEGDLEGWCQFHEQVAKLPAHDREVVGLIYYHRWTQAQVAELFQVNFQEQRRRTRLSCSTTFRSRKHRLCMTVRW